MGIEESLKQILEINIKIFKMLQQSQDVSQIRTELETSIRNFSDVALAIDAKFQDSAHTIIRQVQESYEGLNPELLENIAKLPQRLDQLDSRINEIDSIFKSTQRKIEEDLNKIKAGYVDDVVGRMKDLSENLTTMVYNSTEKTGSQYEGSINSFVSISEDLKVMESHLNSLIENQTDQLATVAELRDRVSAIIQVELASLRDHININLENSVNELKTSVTERLMVQDGTIQRLSQALEGLNQSVADLPEVLKNEINLVVANKLIPPIEEMKKEVKKNSAFILKLQRGKE